MPFRLSGFVRAVAAILPLAVVSLAGCATPPPASDPDALADYNEANDPYEPTNRFFYKVNNGLDTVILRPLAVGYRYITTPGIRTGVANVLSNISSPVQLSDDILEAHPRKAGDTLMRFLINTTVGVGGVFDVAKAPAIRRMTTISGLCSPPGVSGRVRSSTCRCSARPIRATRAGSAPTSSSTRSPGSGRGPSCRSWITRVSRSPRSARGNRS